MKEITPAELKERLDRHDDIQLIDVREAYEREAGNIGGDHIPMQSILASLDMVAKDKDVVVYCRSGARSASVTQALEHRLQHPSIYNLRGGLMAYAREVDPSIQVA
ncbi:MAG: rhodanese-like domain-containing protein [Flavobacteriales bacterium]|nr:rhodanese-like domain-containing protein [Flavobacteriales bacterium]MCB9448235.1 rhodanese-like domain-containing protein [Flavobacteriales bacterium]